MVEARLPYEQIRLKRLEENKKRMEELNLTKLAQALGGSPSKPAPVKLPKPRTPRKSVDLSAVRRSSRVANKPLPSYKEIPIEPLWRIRRSHGRRAWLSHLYVSDEARANAIERAEELQSRLKPEFPSFVKPMLPSHVTGGFWLGLPLHFCKTHLSEHDEMITLVDEDGEESQTKYLAEKNGLSAGWRGFAIDHQLVDGDALVFQLVTPTEFKVYIVRVNDLDSDGNDGEPKADKENEKLLDSDSKDSGSRKSSRSTRRKRGGVR